jgi:hypothetical protein
MGYVYAINASRRRFAASDHLANEVADVATTNMRIGPVGV